MSQNTPVLTEEQAGRIHPVTLAFLGDAVYSLYVRERLVRAGEGKPAAMQKAASSIVSATGQSAFLSVIEQKLTEREAEIFRRGRNAKKATKSKHASVADYNRSTGFEAVLGYLHLTGQTQRILELLSMQNDEIYKIEKDAEVFKP